MTIKILSVAIRHLISCGATPVAVQAFVEDAVEMFDEVSKARWEKIGEYERQRKREQRARNNTIASGEYVPNVPDVPNVPGTNGTKKKGPHTPKEKITPLDNPSGYLPPTAFDEFWAVYPRKVEKGAARKAYRNALKRATVEEILAGTKRYAALKLDREFTKHPTTWLNADCWLDESAKVVEFRNPPKRTWAEIQAEKREKNADGLESGNH